MIVTPSPVRWSTLCLHSIFVRPHPLWTLLLDSLLYPFRYISDCIPFSFHFTLSHLSPLGYSLYYCSHSHGRWSAFFDPQGIFYPISIPICSIPLLAILLQILPLFTCWCQVANIFHILDLFLSHSHFTSFSVHPVTSSALVLLQLCFHWVYSAFGWSAFLIPKIYSFCPMFVPSLLCASSSLLKVSSKSCAWISKKLQLVCQPSHTFLNNIQCIHCSVETSFNHSYTTIYHHAHYINFRPPIISICCILTLSIHKPSCIYTL